MGILKIVNTFNDMTLFASYLKHNATHRKLTKLNYKLNGKTGKGEKELPFE